MTTRWFGEPWPGTDYRAPICEDDALRVPTPVGEACMHCGEPIGENDQGTVIPGYLDLGPDGKPVHVVKLLPAHVECSLRNVLGCYGKLTGGAHTDDEDYREDAHKVQTHVQKWGIQP